MNPKNIIRYVELIINELEDFDVFSINNIIYEHLKPESKEEKDDFHNLVDEIKLFGRNNDLFRPRNNDGWFKLTEKGREFKLSGKTFKKFNKSKNSNKWYNENWVGYAIALIGIFFNVYQYLANRSLRNEIAEYKNEVQIYKDSTFQLKATLKKSIDTLTAK